MQNSERGGDQATDALDLAQRSDLTEGQLNELFASSDPDVRAAVAGNPFVNPAKIYARKGMRTDRFAMRSFARRSDLSQETLDFLGRAGVPWDVLRIVAGNPNTSSVTLERLSRESVAVRQAVASNVRCPPRVLEELSVDRRDLVRLAAAANPSTPADRLAALGGDSSMWVSGVALGNPSIAPDYLANQVADLNSAAWVLNRAANNPACPAPLAEQIRTWIAVGGATGDPQFDPVTLTGNPSPDRDVTPELWFANYASGRSIHDALAPVRYHALAKTAQISDGDAEDLACDPNPEVRIAVNRFNLSSAQIELQTADEDPLVRSVAARAAETIPARKLQEKAIRRNRAQQVSWRWPLRVAIGVIVLVVRGVSSCESRPAPSYSDAENQAVVSSILERLDATIPRPTGPQRSYSEGGLAVAAPLVAQPDAALPEPGVIVNLAYGAVEVSGGHRAAEYPAWLRIKALRPVNGLGLVDVTFTWTSGDTGGSVHIDDPVDLTSDADWFVEMKPSVPEAEMITATVVLDGETQIVELLSK